MPPAFKESPIQDRSLAKLSFGKIEEDAIKLERKIGYTGCFA
jgi:hypothetical protein